MSEQPNQERPVAKASGSGAIVSSPPTGVAPPEMMEAADQGLFGPVPASSTAPSHALSVSALLRSKWLMLGIFVLVSAATIPLIWLLIKPTYRANAAVRVSPVVPRIVFKTEDTGMVPLYQSYLNTQVSIIRSPTVLQRVLDRAQVQRAKWYKEQPRTLRTLLGGTAPTHLERLGKVLSVSPRRGTELIDVSVTMLEPRDAQVIVNAVVDEYKRFTDEAIGTTDRQRLETLREQRAILQKEIEGLVAIKFNRSKQVGAVDPERLRSELVTQRSLLRSQHKQLRREHATAQWELEQLESPPPAEGENEEEASDAAQEEAVADELAIRYAEDAEWRRFNIELQNTRHELELARQQYGESHPRIRQLLASVDYAERLLGERVAELTAQWPGALHQVGTMPEGAVAFRDRAALERLIAGQEQELQRLNKDIEDLSVELSEAGNIAQDIAWDDEKLREKREFYEVVRSRLQALEMERKAPARISVHTYAIVPSEPARDRRFLLTVMALGGAMMTALAVAYLRTSTDPKIREAGDVRRTVRVPFLGQVPPLPASKGLVADCSPAVMESMRMVRTALLERLNGTDDHVVLITSSSRQAGKTNVAIGLAKSLAFLGKKTLLVEADLRRPALAARLGVENDVGLAALLSGAANDSQVIVRGDIAQLDVLPAGKQPVDFDAELLANGVFATCLARWKKSYDFVLVDSPPVLPVADARILASQADGTIMVLRASHCRRTDVVQAYADLSAAGGRLLGTVLVGVRSKGGYDFHEDYHAEHAADSDTSRALKA